MWHRTMALAALAGLCCAQEVKLTAEQVLEKSIEAAGGRKALEKLTSTVHKGAVELITYGMQGTIEIYAKAPNKRLLVTSIPAYGDVRQGFDGKMAWSQDPGRGYREPAGVELEEARREAVFNGVLKWREQFPKVELAGKEKVGDREAYVIRLEPAAGKPVTRYYDAETFLLLRQVSVRDTPEGAMEGRVDLSDYREVQGIRTPFQIHQHLPIAELVIKITEVQHNVDIDDARFARPAQ